MEDRLDRLEQSLANMADSVTRLEQRVAALEGAAEPAQIRDVEPPRLAASPPSGEPAAPGVAATATSILSLAGRSLLVLAGAFLLRAVTDAGSVPTSVGIGLGFAYAAVWLAAMHVAARGGRWLSATFHGVCSAVIGYPLIWEAATTFKVLSPEEAVLALAVVTGVGLAVAWGCRLRPVAWVFTVAAVGTTVALETMSPTTAVTSGCLVLLGLVTLWIARSRDWFLLPWLPAVAADLFVMRAVSTAGAQVPDGVTVPVARLLVTALVVGFVGTALFQVLVRRKLIDAFDVVQTALSLAVGAAGVARLALGTGAGWPGAAVALAGAACYAAAFTVVERDCGRGRNFGYVCTLAMALMLIGSSYLGGELIVSGLWAVLGLLTAFLGSRLDSLTLRVHGAVFATAAAIHGGLLGFAVDALTGPVTGGWRHPPISVHVVLATVTASMVVVASSRQRRELRWFFRLPLVVLVVISAAGLCAELVRLLVAPALFDIENVAALATVRTGVVAVGTLVLAALATRLQISELRWVVYPILFALGLKILLQDLPAGRPLSIAVAFVFYGAALIVSPRLLRTHDRQATAPDSPNAAERLDSGHAPS
jgi:hypothetical protein